MTTHRCHALTPATAIALARALLLALAVAAPALAQEPADSATLDTIARGVVAPITIPADSTEPDDDVVVDPRRQPPPPSTLGAALPHVVLGFSSDAWATVTSPLRMDGEEWLKVGGSLATVALIAAFDTEIQRWIEDHRYDDVPHAIEEIGEFVEPVALMGNTNVYWAGGIVVGWVTGQDEVRHVFEELLYSHWIASLTRKGLGRPVGRLRPFESPDDQFARVYWDGTSFPSGHASTAMQVATVLAHHIDWWPADVALYGLAGTVVYQRTASGAHWLSDSVLGALWGYGVAQIVIDRREADRTDFVPFFDPGSGAVGFRVATPF